MKYVFSAVFNKENGGYSVICPELGVASQGHDLVEAEKNIREAVELYVSDIPVNELAPYSESSRQFPIVKTFEVSHA